MSSSSSLRDTPRATVLPLVWAVAAFVSGCGGGGGMTAVKGKVVLDGNPMTAGSVRFVPDKARGNPGGVEPVGVIGPDGTYSLSTNGQSGAPAGWYKVTVASGDVPSSSKVYATKPALPKRYGNPDLTDLSVEVQSSPPAGAYDLAVRSR